MRMSYVLITLTRNDLKFIWRLGAVATGCIPPGATLLRVSSAARDMFQAMTPPNPPTSRRWHGRYATCSVCAIMGGMCSPGNVLVPSLIRTREFNDRYRHIVLITDDIT